MASLFSPCLPAWNNSVLCTGMSDARRGVPSRNVDYLIPCCLCSIFVIIFHCAGLPYHLECPHQQHRPYIGIRCGLSPDPPIVCALQTVYRRIIWTSAPPHIVWTSAPPHIGILCGIFSAPPSVFSEQTVYSRIMYGFLW